MSIVKMEAVTIAGPIGEFERIVSKYIYGQDIHLENAMSVLNYREQLHTFDEEDHYEPVVRAVEGIMNQAGVNVAASKDETEYSLEEINAFIQKINQDIAGEKERLEQIREITQNNEKLMEQMQHLANLNVDIAKLFDFEFITFRYGRIPQSGYKTLNTYLGGLPAIFLKTDENAQEVWGFYFTPRPQTKKVDEVFNSLYFEETEIPKALRGIPSQTQKRLIQENETLGQEKKQIESKVKEAIKGHYEKLSRIYALAKRRQLFSEIRKNAVHSSEFFYIVGWMPKKEAKELEKQISAERDVVLFVTTEPDQFSGVTPPTKLKNNPVFKPFEFFVKMYGLPSYHELDPTPVLAMTYILFFGIMFGDVGQSAIFAIFGFLLYKLKKIPLAGIIGMVGLSGVVFGFVYGSIFGNETILPHLISPMHSINQMLGITIGMGVFFIIIGLTLNIVNAVKARNFGMAIFGHNGLAGLVFYLTVIAEVASLFFGLFHMPGWLTAVLLIVSILCMYLSEPLANLVNGKKNWLPREGMFYVENLFEMFEVILSYFTNTISFLRIGAFAIVHVGMMMVVAVLSESGGVGGVIVTILGNILVMGLEGLIVGIQVLRLEYYELFSRYFSGQGKEFVSIKDRK